MPKYRTIEPAKYDLKKHHLAFKCAINGIKLAFVTQPNLRFDLTVFVLVNIAAIIYSISLVEYIIILLISAIAICMEMMNTAVEALGDEISKGEFSKLVGVAKDIAGGAVLISDIFAVVIGLIIFLPKMVDQFTTILLYI
jgi:undecaprenol kinase